LKETLPPKLRGQLKINTNIYVQGPSVETSGSQEEAQAESERGDDLDHHSEDKGNRSLNTKRKCRIGGGGFAKRDTPRERKNQRVARGGRRQVGSNVKRNFKKHQEASDNGLEGSGEEREARART